ncbi:MAG: hypothetical protein EA403_13230 [Spirochaetaceae bacterium]|nr:MAG: hypothetical protein EA403_13230 [Spirochaetaceae bacterium]
MRHILVVRHAKSEPAEERQGDFVREITETGRRQVSSIAGQIAEMKLVPERVITSDAVRAVQTAELLCRESGFPGEIEENPELYDATEDIYLKLISQSDDRMRCIMIVGHNPAVEAVVERLIGAHKKMRTGFVAVIEADVAGWRDLIDSDSVQLRAMIEPNGMESKGGKTE